MLSFGAVIVPISIQQSKIKAKAQICQKYEVKNCSYTTLSHSFTSSLYKTHLENMFINDGI